MCAGGGLLFGRGICVLVEGCYLGGGYVCWWRVVIWKGVMCAGVVNWEGLRVLDQWRVVIWEGLHIRVLVEGCYLGGSYLLSD